MVQLELCPIFDGTPTFVGAVVGTPITTVVVPLPSSCAVKGRV